MLKPKVLHQVLSQANTAGVRATILLNSEGSLLASAGEDHDIASAIFANIWASFAKCDSSIDFLLSEQEEGRVALVKVTNSLLLMILGSKTAEFGMLKVKAQKLREYLEAPLKDIMTDPSMEM
jgi:predicted regulator of Ras-like GTPase activity (Roadblock/LC7/MglB family)